MYSGKGQSLAGRVASRFVLVYLLVYLFPFPIGAIPGTHEIAERYGELLESLAPWVGTRLLGFSEVPIQPTGSGDTARAWTQHFLFLALAALVTLALTFADSRRRLRDHEIWPWARVALRYWLASVMLGYGFVKVFKTQFPFPSSEALLKPLGDASPMGLLWRFMGYSWPYNVFAGLAEVLGGVLLLSRRTTTLGALVIAGVMANVAMLNFAYDVPVKAFSVHLLLFAVLLLAPDLRRVARVLLHNRSAPPADLSAPALRARLGPLYLLAKLIVVTATIALPIQNARSAYIQWGPGAPRHPLHGAYEIESFSKDGQLVPPLLTETTRWRRVAVGPRGFTVFFMDDTTRRYGFEHDEPTGKLTLIETPEKKHTLTLTRLDETNLTIEGMLAGAPLSVRLRKIDLDQMELVKRGFHWVNELPYHR